MCFGPDDPVNTHSIADFHIRSEMSRPTLQISGRQRPCSSKTPPSRDPRNLGQQLDPPRIAQRTNGPSTLTTVKPDWSSRDFLLLMSPRITATASASPQIVPPHPKLYRFTLSYTTSPQVIRPHPESYHRTPNHTNLLQATTNIGISELQCVNEDLSNTIEALQRTETTLRNCL